MFSRLSRLHFSTISAQRHRVSKTVLSVLLWPMWPHNQMWKSTRTLTEKLLKYTLGMGTMKTISAPSNYFLRPRCRNKEPWGFFSKEPLWGWFNTFLKNKAALESKSDKSNNNQSRYQMTHQNHMRLYFSGWDKWPQRDKWRVGRPMFKLKFRDYHPLGVSLWRSWGEVLGLPNQSHVVLHFCPHSVSAQCTALRPLQLL